MGIWYDKKAYELLKKCSDAKDLTEWNEYRNTTNYSSINLRFANCNGFYLKEADLQYVDFRFAQINDADFSYANISNANFAISAYLGLFFTLVVIIGALVFSIFKLFGNSFNILLSFSIISILITYFIYEKTYFIRTLQGSFILASGFLGLFIIFTMLSVVISFGGFSFLVGFLKELHRYQNFFGSLGLFLGWAMSFALGTMIYMRQLAEIQRENTKILSVAFNPEQAEGLLKDELKLLIQHLDLSIEYTKQMLRLTKQQKNSEYEDVIDDLKEIIAKHIDKEKDAKNQKRVLDDSIKELEAPYQYINQTITKIEMHNRFYYGAIAVFIGIFIYAIAHGYIDQKMATFSSLFNKETLPSFGSIFGVIIFFGSPVVIGISLIIYFITQINKNIDKITELQEQERNIKQIASTIKAKAQVGMSDEEFVKETKNLIQKYQEGMMAGMFNKEKISDKEDKSSSSTYREKMIANGMSKLLMQALKK